MVEITSSPIHGNVITATMSDRHATECSKEKFEMRSNEVYAMSKQGKQQLLAMCLEAYPTAHAADNQEPYYDYIHLGVRDR